MHLQPKIRREALLPRRKSKVAAAEAQAGAFLFRKETAKRSGKNVLAGAGAKATIRHQRLLSAGTCRRFCHLTNGGKSPPA